MKNKKGTLHTFPPIIFSSLQIGVENQDWRININLDEFEKSSYEDNRWPTILTWFTSSWMLLLLRILLEVSSISLLVILFWDPDWTVLGWTIAGEEDFWVTEAWTLVICCWWDKACGILDDETCCPKCSWVWFDVEGCCCCEAVICCCCEAIGRECGCGRCDLCCRDCEFTCCLYNGDGSGGFPCDPDDNHGWLRDCILWDVLGEGEPGDPTDETLSRLCPWKFYFKKNKLSAILI